MIELVLDKFEVGTVAMLVPTINGIRGKVGDLHETRRSRIEEERGFQ
jgi:hypothetical protein